jgi:hypothetical protein
MASLEQILDSFERTFGKFFPEFSDTLKKNILLVFREEAAEEIKSEFLKVYDELSDREEGEFGSSIQGKDPTSLKRLRPLFEKQLSEEISNVRIEGNQLVLEVMNKGPLGYASVDRSGPAETVDILVFYIEGVSGEFAFLTPEQYEERGRKSSNPLGRYGDGFLIPKDRYKSERWAEVTGVPFQAVRHPISGQPPFRGFEAVAEKINYQKYI